MVGISDGLIRDGARSGRKGIAPSRAVKRVPILTEEASEAADF